MDLNALAERYASMETDELVSLHQAGTLLDEAYPVLESELARRGVVIDPRPAAVIIAEEPPFFSGHWSGSHSAASAIGFAATLVPAFWALGSYLLFATARYLWPDSERLAALATVLALAFLAYLVFASVAVWRCSRHGPSTMGAGVSILSGLFRIAIFGAGGIWALAESLR